MNDEQSLYERHKKELLAGLVVFAALTLIIGLMLAWFFGQRSASTVGAIKAPTAIAIYGPNQTYMEQFDLSYDRKEVEDNGEVTIKRPFTIVSPTDKIVLYIAHTTNITDLVIKIYSAEDVTGKATSAGDKTIEGVDARGQRYVWKLNMSNVWQLGANGVSNGKYLNKANDYKAVDPDDPYSLRIKIFSNADSVHQNADPLYWKPSGNITLQKINESYTGNFIMEATWTEREKETDVIYLIAKST